MSDPSTGPRPADDAAPDPGNTDPAQLVAPLDEDDDAVERLAALLNNPDTDDESDSGDDSGDDDQLGY